jgi:curved DNA-binding protein CbpA
MKATLTLCVLILLGILLCPFSKDLYSVLGVKKSASLEEIKRAYRMKARETHPDKRKKDVSAEEASMQFREVVEAFETLSDDSSRKAYDRQGGTYKSQQSNGRGAGQRSHGHPGSGQYTWNFNFGGGFGGQSNTRKHRFLFDHVRRQQIFDAQSRTINIRPNLNQLRNVIYSDELEGGKPSIERYVLIAFYDSTSSKCVNKMNNEILYPWPFAGYSNEVSDVGMWWEEILVALKVDLANGIDTAYSADEAEAIQRKKKQFVEHFKLNVNDKQQLADSSCPSFTLIPRGSSLADMTPVRSFTDTDQFREWVWPQLKMTVTVINSTPWELSSWWIDGTRGHQQEPLAVGDSVTLNTFISHSFFYRVSWVTGRTLTNEVRLRYA